MKRVWMIFMTIAVMLALAGCGNETDQETGSGEVSQDSGEQAGQGMSQGTGQDSGEQAGQGMGQDTGKEAGQGMSQDTGKEAGQDTGQETGQENSLTQESSSGSVASPGEDAGAQQAETSKETIELRKDYKDNFDVDEAAAAEFAKMIKEAVAQKDVEMLAGLTGFPVYVGLSGGMTVETREDFIALDVEDLLSDEMVTSIAAAEENNLSPSMAGFTLCGGEGAPSITFGVREGSLAISGINYGY